MITKTYKSVYNPYVINLRIANELVRVKFTGEYKTSRQGSLTTFVTNDEAIQKAIEGLRSFGEKGKAAIWLAGAVETKEPVISTDVILTDVKVYSDITTYEEAKVIMMGEPYNCKVQAVNTLERLLTRATKEGISFPNLKAE